jgi:hypothetical protein
MVSGCDRRLCPVTFNQTYNFVPGLTNISIYRYGLSADVDDRTLHEVYWWPFLRSIDVRVHHPAQLRGSRWCAGEPQFVVGGSVDPSEEPPEWPIPGCYLSPSRPTMTLELSPAHHYLGRILIFVLQYRLESLLLCALTTASTRRPPVIIRQYSTACCGKRVASMGSSSATGVRHTTMRMKMRMLDWIWSTSIFPPALVPNQVVIQATR